MCYLLRKLSQHALWLLWHCSEASFFSLGWGPYGWFHGVSVSGSVSTPAGWVGARGSRMSAYRGRGRQRTNRELSLTAFLENIEHMDPWGAAGQSGIASILLQWSAVSMATEDGTLMDIWYEILTFKQGHEVINCRYCNMIKTYIDIYWLRDFFTTSYKFWTGLTSLCWLTSVFVTQNKGTDLTQYWICHSSPAHYLSCSNHSCFYFPQMCLSHSCLFLSPTAFKCPK